MARRGRKPKSQEQKLRDALERSKPPEHIERHRQRWSFVTPTKGPDGRGGTIDQDICDGIGQFHALGLLDNDIVDPQILRDLGREWSNLYIRVMRMMGSAPGGGADERVQNKRDYVHTVIGADQLKEHEMIRFDRLDSALTGYERSVLQSLLIDPVVGSWPLGEENCPWVRAHIAKGLLERGRIPPGVTRFPDCEDDAKLEATLRGLFVLWEASLPGRYERRAA